jgi:hypothetical protein
MDNDVKADNGIFSTIPDNDYLQQTTSLRHNLTEDTYEGSGSYKTRRNS